MLKTYTEKDIENKATRLRVDSVDSKLSKRMDDVERVANAALEEIDNLQYKTKNLIPPDITEKLRTMTVQRSLSIPVTVEQGGTGITNNNYFYLGGSEQTDGAWRLAISGSDLSIQRRESGTWTEKSAILAS